MTCYCKKCDCEPGQYCCECRPDLAGRGRWRAMWTDFRLYKDREFIDIAVPAGFMIVEQGKGRYRLELTQEAEASR